MIVLRGRILLVKKKMTQIDQEPKNFQATKNKYQVTVENSRKVKFSLQTFFERSNGYQERESEDGKKLRQQGTYAVLVCNRIVTKNKYRKSKMQFIQIYEFGYI